MSILQQQRQHDDAGGSGGMEGGGEEEKPVPAAKRGAWGGADVQGGGYGELGAAAAADIMTPPAKKGAWGSVGKAQSGGGMVEMRSFGNTGSKPGGEGGEGDHEDWSKTFLDSAKETRCEYIHTYIHTYIRTLVHFHALLHSIIHPSCFSTFPVKSLVCHCRFSLCGRRYISYTASQILSPPSLATWRCRESDCWPAAQPHKRNLELH